MDRTYFDDSDSEDNDISSRPPLNSLQRRRVSNAKSRSRRTIKGTPIGGLSSAGKNSLHNDDSTVAISNRSKNLKSRRLVAPRIATLSDYDPSCNVQKPPFASVNDDIEDGDIHEEGRDDIMIMSSINVVDIHCISWSPAVNV